MIFGSLDPWSDVFPEGLIPHILDLVISAWAEFPRPNRDDHEVPITQKFRSVLIRNKNLIRLPVSISREVPEDDLRTGNELGRIDLIFTHGNREDVYFSFECKRLNVVLNGRRKILATEYMKAGMMRYITSQYAASLLHGGMIGYILDGDSTTAINRINEEIKKHCKELKINSPEKLYKSSIRPNDKQVRETKHQIELRQFIIHHVFLSA